MPTTLTSTGVTFPDATTQTSAVNSLSDLSVTATAAELNKLDGVTASTTEINKLDGLTSTTAELNYTDGVTSNIQTQLNAKAASSSLGNLASLNSVNAATITDNSVGAAELNVSGNGTSGQVLKTDGDGSFSWIDAGGGVEDVVFIGAGTVKAGGNRVMVSGTGAGGGGTGGVGNNPRHGAGAGGKGKKVMLQCTAGETITFTLGNGGNGGGWASPGNPGQASTVVGSSTGNLCNFGGGYPTPNQDQPGQGGNFSSNRKTAGWHAKGTNGFPTNQGGNGGTGETFGYSTYGTGGRSGSGNPGGTGGSGMIVLHGFYTA